MGIRWTEATTTSVNRHAIITFLERAKSKLNSKPTILFISQVYVPDPAAVGQQMADAAAELHRRGNRVVTLTSRRGYENPSELFPAREVINGVEVYRIPLASFGKSSIPIRVFGGLSFLVQVVFRALFMRKLDALVVSTSPPMCSLAALVISFFRGMPITYWVMDINPDQAVALGKVNAHAWSVRAFDWLNRRILSQAAKVVALDEFMAERLEQKQTVGDRMVVSPPWPHNSEWPPVPHENNPFRDELGVQEKFVVMYSGNMSIAHSLDTLLLAAKRLESREDIVFLLIGGGQGRKSIDEFLSQHGPSNVRLLPYQPLDQIQFSLSAADLHVVSMGDEMVGIVHPCKIYGAMACARPVFLLGPQQCHVGQIIESHKIGYQVDHGDVESMVQAIESAQATSGADLAEMGHRGRIVVLRQYSREVSRGRFCDIVEQTLSAPKDTISVPATATAGTITSTGSIGPLVGSRNNAALRVGFIGSTKSLMPMIRRRMEPLGIREVAPRANDAMLDEGRVTQAWLETARPNTVVLFLPALTPAISRARLGSYLNRIVTLKHCCSLADIQRLIVVAPVNTLLRATSPISQSRGVNRLGRVLQQLHVAANGLSSVADGYTTPNTSLVVVENLFGLGPASHRKFSPVADLAEQMTVTRSVHQGRISVPFAPQESLCMCGGVAASKFVIRQFAVEPDEQNLSHWLVESTQPRDVEFVVQQFASLCGFHGRIEFSSGTLVHPNRGGWNVHVQTPNKERLRKGLARDVAALERRLQAKQQETLQGVAALSNDGVSTTPSLSE